VFTQVLLTGTYVQGDGEAAQGYVEFTPTADLVNPIGGAPTVVPAQPIASALNAEGQLTGPTGSPGLPLYANNDTGTTPQNQGYLVQEYLGPEPSVPYVIIVPSGTPTNTVDISQLIPVPTIPDYYDYFVTYDSTFESAARAAVRIDQAGTPLDSWSNGGWAILQNGSPFACLAETIVDTATAAYTATTSPTALNSGLLNVSFVVPQSGNVVVELEGFITGGGQGYYGWGIATHGTTTALGYWNTLKAGATSTSAFGERARAQVRLTSLTPGATIEVDWIHEIYNGASFAAETATSPGTTFAPEFGEGYGPLFMRALAA
jgi:hypothetical protein